MESRFDPGPVKVVTAERGYYEESTRMQANPVSVEEWCAWQNPPPSQGCDTSVEENVAALCFNPVGVHLDVVSYICQHGDEFPGCYRDSPQLLALAFLRGRLPPVAAAATPVHQRKC